MTFVSKYKSKGNGCAVSEKGNGFALTKSVSVAKFLKAVIRINVYGKCLFTLLRRTFQVQGILKHWTNHQGKHNASHKDGHVYIFLHPLFYCNGAADVEAVTGLKVTEMCTKKPRHL